MAGHPNWSNRTLFTGDNLDVMRGMNSETVDLIYLDPPFNSKKDYAAPIGSKAAGAVFTDTWSLDDVKQEWAEELESKNPALWHTIIGAGYTADDSMQAYLTYMAIRLEEMHRIIKPTGTLYLHCDPTASHYLKQLLDAIFGFDNFKNEIVWHYGKMSNTSVNFPRNHDIILRYVKSNRFTFTPIKGAESEYRNRFARFVDDKNQVKFGSVRQSRDKLVTGRVKKVEKQLGRNIADEDVLFDFNVEFKVQSDVIYVPIIKGNAAENTGYPTQKPLALVAKLIEASSSKGDIAFDPFCGCATTCVAAEMLDREWIGVDIEEKARDLVEERCMSEVWAKVNETPTIAKALKFADEKPQIISLNKPPKRTDLITSPRSANIKEVLYKRQTSRCAANCEDGVRLGRMLPIDLLEMDHIRPRSKGGPDIDDNLQLLCPTCNRSKGNRTMSWLLNKQARGTFVER